MDHRPRRPHWPDHPPYADAEDAVLFSGLAPAQSYPAGHALNTIVWFGVIVILVGGAFTTWQRRLLLFAPPVIAFASMVHLGWHWFSDAPAGIFLGVIIMRIVQRIRWDTIELPSWLEPEKRYLLGHAPSDERRPSASLRRHLGLPRRSSSDSPPCSAPASSPSGGPPSTPPAPLPPCSPPSP
ncbi:hypothetical protein GCM10029992_03970 [Glycomyces albus]